SPVGVFAVPAKKPEISGGIGPRSRLLPAARRVIRSRCPDSSIRTILVDGLRSCHPTPLAMPALNLYVVNIGRCRTAAVRNSTLLHWARWLCEHGDVERSATRNRGSELKCAVCIYRKIIR